MVTETKAAVQMGRRNFLGVTAAAGGLLLVKPSQVRGTQANSALRVGLLGCGGRGTHVADVLLEHPNTRMVALADLFADQLENGKHHFDEIAGGKGYAGIDTRLMFKGSKAFRRVAECKEVDLIILSTPDYFHPQHLEAVVEAGKHVYCEKPAAVDVVGCKRFLEIGKRAEGRLSLDVGFNVRHAPPFAELVRRIHAGAIGEVAAVSSFYHAPKIDYPPRPNASPLEARIRNFYWDRVLSGDVIVDQNIHMIDICNWALQTHPVKAIGTGGRKVRNDGGNTWDHFSVVFTYPGGRHVSFNSVQFGETFWDVGTRFFGAKGMAESYYSGVAHVVGPEPWRWPRPAEPAGAAADPMNLAFSGVQDADANKTRDFVDSIVSGKYHNQSAEGAEAALSAILGRMAAYSGREVTWDEMLASNQSYGEIDLASLDG
jgi:myo-inositol 2-dehydrogenase/D-chiro-inositol 1-dehydrogenase